MVKSVLQSTHGETLLVAEMTTRLLWGTGHPLPVTSCVGLNILANLAEELLVPQFLHPIASLVKTSIAAIAIDDSILIFILCTETYLAICLKEWFQLLDASHPATLVSLSTHLPDSGNLQGLLQHFLGLIAVTAFEVEKNFSHSKVTFDLSDIIFEVERWRMLFLPFEHFPPMTSISICHLTKFSLIEQDLSLDLIVLGGHHIVMQIFHYLILTLLPI